VAAIPLSLPLVLLLESSVHRSLVAAEVRGGLVGPAGGPYVVGLAPDVESAIEWPAGRQQGTFELRLEDRLDGWPLTTRVTRGVVAVDLSFFDELTDREDVRPPADSPVGSAIIAALDVPEVSLELPVPIPRVVRAWGATGVLPASLERRRYWPGSVAAVAVAWLGLSVAAIAGVAVARYGWNLLTQARDARRHRSRQSGRCASCGFDLRGNVFSDRCPECGALSD